jgi:hypothetical protein
MPDLDQFLDTLVADVAAGTRPPGAPMAIRQAHRRRVEAAIAGGVAIAVVSVVAAASLDTDERSADLPQPADRHGLTSPLVAPKSLLEVRELGFHVEPVPEVVLTGGWALEPDRQSTHIKVFGDGGPTDLQVTVYYQGRSPQRPPTGTAEAVTVNGVPGTYVDDSGPDFWAAHLNWEYSPNLWAEVSTWLSDGSAPSDLRSRLLTAAEAVRSGGEIVRIPVRVGTVPAWLPPVTTPHDVNVDYLDGDWSWWLSLNDEVHLWATSNTGMDCQGSDGSPYTENFTYRGYEGCLVDGERLGLRLGTANAFIDFVDADPSIKRSTEDMKELLAHLTIASPDPTTWFDLQTALGGD